MDVEEKPRPQLRLKSFEVQGLFGLFDHQLEFRTDDRITILHGPNGVGKTTVLRMIEGVFRPRSAVWSEVRFDRVVVKLLPAGSLTIIPSGEGGNGLSYTYRRGKTREHAVVDKRRADLGLPLSAVDDVVPWLTRMGERSWRDDRTMMMLSVEDVLERYPEHFPLEGPSYGPPPAWLDEILSGVSVQFIRTQRLRNAIQSSRRVRVRRTERGDNAVDRLSEDLTSRIRDSLRRSGSLAASLDRTFPKRLLEGKLPRTATEEKIREEYRAQEKLRNRLMEAGLLDAEEDVPLPDTQIGESERKVLWYYLRDVKEKLSVYEPLLERVELFKSIIDGKQFLYKQMQISARSGIDFTTESGDQVPLSALSSGEQHELVLTYELLFGKETKSLILIDEPELSLHVTWQREFLEDMEKIAGVVGIDFVVATHSPSIVNNRRDLMIGLSGVCRD